MVEGGTVTTIHGGGGDGGGIAVHDSGCWSGGVSRPGLLRSY